MLILVTGGSGSGKSAYAEDCIVSFNNPEKIYIATMYCWDDESRKRVERHRKMRSGKGFRTLEQYTNLSAADVAEGGVVLLECMSNLVANEMFLDEGAHSDTVESVIKGVEHLLDISEHVVIVTNEIFSEVMEYEGDTVQYQQYLGEINQRIAAMADRVTEVVYGIPIVHKAGGQA